jgi:enoyl-CoA hydratase/carnithine racemase
MSNKSPAYIAAVHPKFDDYCSKYPHVAMQRQDGILQLTLNTDGDSLEWSFEVHHELGYCWADVGADPDNKLIVLTGAGDSFIARASRGYRTKMPDAREWIFDHTEAKRLVGALLDIEQPIIAAINGPVFGHAELPLLADIVLMSDDAYLRDPHVKNGLVPGDGIHVLLPLLLGLNRAKYYMLTGKKIEAQEALALGLVAEVLPKAKILPRALELAREIMQAPEGVVRLFRPTLMQNVKRLMLDGLSHGLMLEGMAALEHWPSSKE